MPNSPAEPTVALRLPQRLTHEQVAQCLAQWDLAAAAHRGADLTLDASVLEQFDSSALALLLHCHRQAHAAGRSLHVLGLPARLRELAQLYGVHELIAPTR